MGGFTFKDVAMTLTMPDGKEVGITPYIVEENVRKFPSRILKMSARRKKKSAQQWLRKLIAKEVKSNCTLTDRGYALSDVQNVILKTLSEFRPAIGRTFKFTVSNP